MDVDELVVVAIDEVAIDVQHVGEAAGKARREIESRPAEHAHHATGHVFTAVIARPLDDGERAGVTHRESLAGAAGKSTMTARLAYVAAKAGIVGFTNQLARDLEELGISANAIMPGFTLTEPGARIYEQFHKLSPQDREAMLKRMKIPPRSAEEIGFASSAILAQGAANLTGCVVRVAGGKMESPDLKFTDEGQTPLGRGVRIEPK